MDFVATSGAARWLFQTHLDDHDAQDYLPVSSTLRGERDTCALPPWTKQETAAADDGDALRHHEVQLSLYVL